LKQLAKSIFLGSLVIATLIFGSYKANADISTSNAQKKPMSAEAFNDKLKQTTANQITLQFGEPDKIEVIKTADGKSNAAVWVYHDAVRTAHNTQDARFTLINGKLYTVTLADAPFEAAI
jgi:hypothetical protein